MACTSPIYITSTPNLFRKCCTMERHINANAVLAPAVYPSGHKSAVLVTRGLIKGEVGDNVKLEPLITTELNIKNETYHTLSVREPAKEDNRLNKQLCVKELHKCTLCRFQTPYKDLIEKHINEHVLGKPFSSTEGHCNDVQAKTLNIHPGGHNQVYEKPNVMCHSGERSFNCEICDYKSATQYALQLHLQHHIEQRSFKCKICHYSFSHMAVLKRHMDSYQKTFSNTFCE